jgi:D-alanyl-D-alanine carboxypeptidase
MRDRARSLLTVVLFVAALTIGSGGGDNASAAASKSIAVPADIQSVFNEPLYKGAKWGLRVVDPGTGKVLIDLNSNYGFYIGSVRKVFSVGELLNQVGPDHRDNTPVYRSGTVDASGVLHGNLILVASGDLTMGGRTNPDGSIAVSNYDHNEADSLGNAVLTAPNPLAGYAAIARQIANAGIKRVAGDVVIDDRLFQPFDFRHEFDVRPIFVNDDVVDLTINPTSPGHAAAVTWRPHSAALNVASTLVTGAAGSNYTLSLEPEFPACIGTRGCIAKITGNLPVNFRPPLTNAFPLVQTFRIVQPSNYARTILIEQLETAGITVDAPAVGANPVRLLPAKGSYRPATKIAELKGMPYSDDAKLILKVSYNIGADTSLLLYGLTQGVDNMSAALAVEKTNLATHYGIPSTEYNFVDGSGGGPSTATNLAVTKFLSGLTTKPAFPVFFNALPVLGVDGSLSFVTNFESDPTLAGATGRVHAKTGTYALGSESGIALKGQALGGYVNTRSGKQLVFELAVNNVKLGSINDVLQVFQDQGKIAAMIWRDN